MPIGVHRETPAQLAVISQRAPQLAGDIAYRRFCAPLLSAHRSADHHKLTARARFHLRAARWERLATAAGEVQVYVLEPDALPGRGTVLVVHGWTSEASFMTAFAEPIRRAGFRVVLMDCPAHGKSGERHATLVDCARAAHAVARHYGPIYAFVAHSFGSQVALLIAEGGAPMPSAIPVERVVLVAAPNALAEVTGNFARSLQLTDAARRAYERHLERVGHRSIATFTTAHLLRAVARPALLLHARDDHEVPIHNAEQIVAACPTAELVTFDGFGHRKILYAPPAIRAAVSFLTR